MDARSPPRSERSEPGRAEPVSATWHTQPTYLARTGEGGSVHASHSGAILSRCGQARVEVLVPPAVEKLLGRSIYPQGVAVIVSLMRQMHTRREQ